MTMATTSHCSRRSLRLVALSALLGLCVALGFAGSAGGSLAPAESAPAFGWGKNNGDLGDGGTASRSTPVAVSTTSPAPSMYTDISGAGDHSCGVGDDGQAFCWGSGAYGELGTGNFSSVTTPVAVTTAGGLPDTYKAVGAGEYFTCGLGTDDSAYCWGNNDEGQLGDGSTTTSSNPVPVLAGASPGQFKALAVSAFTACALGIDDRAYCWGYGAFGNRGDDTTTRRATTPVAVSIPGGTTGTYASIAAGDHRTCAVTAAGAAYCWGEGGNGGIGNGANANVAVPTRVSAGQSSGLFASVVPGGGQTCGISLDDSAYCWGDNSSGQLGDGSTTRRSTPTAVDASGALPDAYTLIAAGRDFSCGVDLQGLGYCWGSNGNGESGSGSFGGTMLTPTAVSVSGVLAGRRIVAIDNGPEFSVAIAALAPRSPTFDTPVAAPGGFSVNVTNYDASWTWSPTVTAGTVSSGTPIGSMLPLTVSGLSADQLATVSLVTARAGYVDGSGSITGQAAPAPSPTPAPPTPASAPIDVRADAGNASATVTWSPPVSGGSFTVSHYLVTSAPGGHVCLTTDLTCEVSGLTNGTSYTFRVAALTGAGWSARSAPSGVVVPRADPRPDEVTITITGSRADGVITVEGTTTGMGMGGIVTPWFKRSSGSFTQGRDVLVSMDGTFTWSRAAGSGRTWTVYFAAGDARSNVLTLRR
jgi:alpha-tubulin suppressor-like RCC1 family protein